MELAVVPAESPVVTAEGKDGTADNQALIVNGEGCAGQGLPADATGLMMFPPEITKAVSRPASVAEPTEVKVELLMP